MCDFDPETLIEEVKKRPAIWDSSSSDYNLKELKSRCWQEIADLFNTNESASKYERIELSRQLKRKWKSLRDCFSREVCKRRRAAKHPSAAKRTAATYIYYKPMSFLLRVGRPRAEADSPDAEEDEPAAGEEDEAEAADEEDAQERALRKSYRSRNTLKMEVESVDNDDSEEEAPLRPKKLLKRTLARGAAAAAAAAGAAAAAAACARDESGAGGGAAGAQGEGERMFLLSLVGPLLQVPAHMRLAVQMDMMSVIQNAINTNNPEFVMAEADVDYDDD